MDEFLLGGFRALDGSGYTRPLRIAPEHLATHACVFGMTGSGKTGVLLVLAEEALRQRIPVLMIDVKGDLANVFLTFPDLEAADFASWHDPASAARKHTTVDALGEASAQAWREGLAAWHLDGRDIAALREGMAPRLLTPGTHAGEPLHVLSALEQPAALDWENDIESARNAVSASISLLLRLVHRDDDPTSSRDHVVLSLLAESRLRSARPADLESLLVDLATPPIDKIGAMTLDEFLPKRERHALATALNTLLASPTFAAWREGAAIDPGAWLSPTADGKAPAVVLSVAHLDDDERQVVLGVVLQQVLAWVRTLPGTSDLRALIVMDEVFGFVPPHPASPPTKRPLIQLLKQARAMGVGIVLATQNPMDVDYRALSNAGLWCVGRLQTDADRARVIDGLMGSDAGHGVEISRSELANRVKHLAPRWFLVRDVHRDDGESTVVMQSRWTLSWLRGPLTRAELVRLKKCRLAP